MKRFLFGLPLLVVLLALPGLRGHGDEPKKVDSLMRKKVQHAQKVLEAIALNDFKTIVDQGEDLLLVSKEAEWKVIKTNQYDLYSDEFRRAVETMIQKAMEKNLDGATLGYVEMTMSCVRCHKHVREVRRI